MKPALNNEKAFDEIFDQTIRNYAIVYWMFHTQVLESFRTFCFGHPELTRANIADRERWLTTMASGFRKAASRLAVPKVSGTKLCNYFPSTFLGYRGEEKSALPNLSQTYLLIPDVTLMEYVNHTLRPLSRKLHGLAKTFPPVVDPSSAQCLGHTNPTELIP